MKYIVSISFGKDSLAMLLRLLEENKPIDEVVFFDTEMEFSCIYQIMKRIELMLDEKGIKFTRLKAKQGFMHMMLNHEVKHRDGTTSHGYKWCGGVCRWFTSQKTQTIKNYLKKYDEYIEYVGIAVDEPKRFEKNRNKLLPLVEWNMTEKDCLDYCHKKGFYWYEGERELYDYLDRVSCWCCKNKNLKELKNIYKYFNHYWLALCELERRCEMRMKHESLLKLEEKWSREYIQEEMKFQ